MQTGYSGVECSYSVMLFENVLLCILGKKFVVPEKRCSIVHLFFYFLFLDFSKQEVGGVEDARGDSWAIEVVWGTFLG